VYNVEYCVKIGIHSRSPTSSSWKKIWNNVILNIESYIEFCIFFLINKLLLSFAIIPFKNCNYLRGFGRMRQQTKKEEKKLNRKEKREKQS
jgi:hypothetical protein